MLLEIVRAGGLLWLAAALGLVVLTVTIHAVGFGALLRAVVLTHALDASGFWRITAVLIGVTCWLIMIHLVEISVWGLFYFWQGCLPDTETAMYFSGATYTSVGYGDLVLPKPWRLLIPLETLTGILMCGLSTGLFFAMVLRWVSSWIRVRTRAQG
jgi:hypothetical protein